MKIPNGWLKLDDGEILIDGDMVIHKTRIETFGENICEWRYTERIGERVGSCTPMQDCIYIRKEKKDNK